MKGVSVSCDSDAAIREPEHYDIEQFAKPLTYSTERTSEPAAPTWQNLLDDIAACSSRDQLFKDLNQEPSSLKMSGHDHDSVALAQITVEVQVAARNLALLKKEAKARHDTFQNSLQILKEDLDDLT